MIVYHGSTLIIDKPDLKHSRKRVDFGPGFYVTPLREQARRLCERHIRSGLKAYISSYELDESVFQNYRVLKFDTYSEEWLDFVFRCRRGEDQSDYQIVMGGVANDKVFDTVELYFDGLITKEIALGRLCYEKPNSQICIRSQDVLDSCLTFMGSEQI